MPLKGLRKKVNEEDSKLLAGITQELYGKNVELAHTNQTLSLLRTIDNLVLESREGVKEVCTGVCKAIIDSFDYLFAGIFAVEKVGGETLHLSGFAFSEELNVSSETAKLLSSLTMTTTSPWFSNEAKIESIDAANIGNSLFKQVFTHNLHLMEKLSAQAQLGSLLLIKLYARQKLVGVLVVGSQKNTPEQSEEDRLLLERLGEAIGLAVDNKLLFEENQRVLHKLELSNKKLQALDEAKDEFISMASHQLRTPLTSVKGYISMVLEGDTGKINKQQQELLRQSYTSAQRMVYLISDLLNVSRLRTGKFLIEPTPIYLPDVIEEELKQVEETAKSRGVKLVFKKPKTYPTLNLDNTKIRQVIMNFVDNAIYYTPKGGEVKVELESNANRAEFRVKDDGIGVPKSEQHHLFMKFYRAANARKTRPDGTGLGLFMAKKVVVASGGALIFSSQENKGSTFGFTFPLKNTEQPNKPSKS